MAPPPYRPSVDDVAAELRTRTRGPDTYDSDGTEGTFTDETRPTAVQVDELIDRALALLAPRLGTVPTSLHETAKAIVCLRAAMLVERSYFPEDVEEDRGVYTSIRDELSEALAAYDQARKGDAPAQQSPRSGSLRVATLLTNPEG